MAKSKIICMAMLLFVLLFSSLTYATEAQENKDIFYEIKFGLLAHDMDGLWSGFKREQGADLNCEAMFSFSQSLFGGSIHPVIGVSLNTHGSTSKVYLDGFWRYEITEDLFGGFGLGVAVHDGEKHPVSRDMKALGSNILFHIPVEIGYRLDPKVSFSVYYDHMSNAEIKDANEGMDTLGFRVGYTF